MMKVGCSSWSFHKTIEAGDLDQNSWLDVCARDLSLDGVELLDYHFTGTDDAYVKDLKVRCCNLGLSILGLAISNNFTCADAERAAQEESVSRWLDAAAILGAPAVRVFAGTGQGLAVDGMWPKCVGSLRTAASQAGERGIVLGLENHGGLSADQVIRLLDDVGSPYLRMTLDTGNFPEDDLGSIEKTAPRAVYVHAKTYGFDAAGEETRLPYERIVEILGKVGFNGYLSIEFEGEGDEMTDVTKSVALLRRCLSRG